MDQPLIVAGDDRARLAVRAAGDYFLRSLNLLAELADGELVTALVSLAIVQANVGHLDRQDGRGAEFGDASQPPPDALRRPASILSIASTLGLPYETTRRHVGKLIAAGRCEYVGRGYIVPARALSGPRHEAMLRANLANLRQLFKALRRAGIDFG